MKHIHGIAIHLLDQNNIPVAENPPDKATALSLRRFNGQVGSRNFCLPAGTPFKICVTLHREFKIYKAEGVKIVVVVGDGDGYEDGKRRERVGRGCWWVGVEDLLQQKGRGEGMGREYVIEGKRKGFFVPQIDANYENVKATSWVTHEQYCANRGCVAVFVERGKLIESKGNTVRAKAIENAATPIPIEYGDFVPLNSPNADPYVFEFRNVEASDVNPPLNASKSMKTDEFGGEPKDLISDTEIVYDTEDGCLSEEEEAEATDSTYSDSDSNYESQFVVSEDSEEELPGPRKRKRKASTPHKHSSSKKQRTTAEKNAEADATNGSFGNREKNAHADGTNPSLGRGIWDYDRDDEEVPLMVVKREPRIKEEKSESAARMVLPQRSSTKASVPGSRLNKSKRGSGQGTEIVDVTQDHSEDEVYGYEKKATLGAFRKLSGSGGNRLVQRKKGKAKMR